MKIKTRRAKPLGHSESSPIRETVLGADIKKSERAQINDPMMQHKNWGKKEQIKSKPTRWQEIIKSRAEINEKNSTNSTMSLTTGSLR